MNLSQARVVDPVLTEHARGWTHPERVGSLLFPRVPVNLRGGKVLEFGKESFQLYNIRRAPGAAVKQVDFAYEGRPYVLTQDMLDTKIPEEISQEARAVPGVDLGMRATNMLMQNMTLGLEVEQAAIATSPASYAPTSVLALSGGSQWNDAASKPMLMIDDARHAVRKVCGVYPNVAIAGPRVYQYLRRHPSIRAQFQNVDIVTNELLARVLDLDTLAEGRAIVADATGKFSDVWGNYFILAYAPQAPDGQEQPSFGYTYTLKDNPLIRAPFWDNTHESWMYRGVYERAPLLTGMDAGFLFTNVVADGA